jgi:hypothetical protein
MSFENPVPLTIMDRKLDYWDRKDQGRKLSFEEFYQLSKKYDTTFEEFFCLKSLPEPQAPGTHTKATSPSKSLIYK